MSLQRAWGWLLVLHKSGSLLDAALFHSVSPPCLPVLSVNFPCFLSHSLTLTPTSLYVFVTACCTS